MVDPILVIAGEPSGDRALAGIVRALGLPSFGIGGDALASSGTELLAHVRDVSGMGLFELGARVPAIARALVALTSRVRTQRPPLALLASWSAANARIAPWLRRSGVRVVWVSPPEVWAWRSGRARRLAHAADVLLPTLPFEEAIWRAAGADARFVGHPAIRRVDVDRSALRGALRLSSSRPALAILPGSRPAEIARLAEPFLQAGASLDVDARVLVAPGLDRSSRARIEELSARHGVATVEVPAEGGASALLPAFDVALVASGTASLEAAACGVPPVIAYAMHPLTMAIARRVVRTPYVGLPNVLLWKSGRAAPFRERLQEDVTETTLARALAETLDDPRCGVACRAVSDAMWVDRDFADRAAEIASARIPDGRARRT